MIKAEQPLKKSLRWYDYTVCEGDTLAEILRISAASVRELKTHNAHCNLLNLQPGQRLRVPHARPVRHAYRVRRGEDVYSLARKFGSSVAALLKINTHLRPAEIRQGAHIALPKD